MSHYAWLSRNHGSVTQNPDIRKSFEGAFTTNASIDKKAEQQEELTTKPKKRSRKSKGSFIETRLCAGK
ncbi:MAG: hypothetical protein WCR87_07770, partial [Saccharofermentanales bacterium]